MDKKGLTKLRNNATGSEFFVIGEDPDNGFVGGIRFWIDRPHGGYNVQFGFRFRVERAPGEPPATNVGHMLESAYPTVQWKTLASRYGSVFGGIDFRPAQLSANAVMSALDTSGAITAIYNALRAAFPTMTFLLTQEEFKVFLLSDTEEGLKVYLEEIGKREGDPGIVVSLSFVTDPTKKIVPKDEPANPTGNTAEVVKLAKKKKVTPVDVVQETNPQIPEETPPLAETFVDAMVQSKPEGMTVDQATTIAKVVAGGDMSTEAIDKAAAALGESIESGAIAAPDLQKPKKKSKPKILKVGTTSPPESL